MPKEKSIKIHPLLTLVCDDVRLESNGKPFLIGVYTGGANFEAPLADDTNNTVNWPIHLWMPFKVNESGVASFEIQVIGPNPQHIFHAKAKLQIPNLPQPTEITPIDIGPIPLKIWQSGEVKILFKNEDESEWETLRIIPVTFKVVEVSNAPISPISIGRPF